MTDLFDADSTPFAAARFILSSGVTFFSKRNSYNFEDLNDFLKDAVNYHWEFDCKSGWEKLS